MNLAGKPCCYLKFEDLKKKLTYTQDNYKVKQFLTMRRGNVIFNGSIFNLIERNITPPSDEFVLAVGGPKYFQTSTSH
jgi:hypothetical protein